MVVVDFILQVLVVLVNLHRLQDQELKEQTLLLLVYQQQGEEQEEADRFVTRPIGHDSTNRWHVLGVGERSGCMLITEGQMVEPGLRCDTTPLEERANRSGLMKSRVSARDTHPEAHGNFLAGMDGDRCPDVSDRTAGARRIPID